MIVIASKLVQLQLDEGGEVIDFDVGRVVKQSKVTGICLHLLISRIALSSCGFI